MPYFTPFCSIEACRGWGPLRIGKMGRGTGLGDPIERAPELIVRDMERNMATLRAAREVYCVAIDQETLKVDYKKTERLREERKKERLKKGIPAREYIKQMAEKRKNRGLPKPALDFLDEMMEYSEEFRKRLKQEDYIDKD